MNLGGKINREVDGLTPLISAVQGGSLPTVRVLIERGAFINFRKISFFFFLSFST